jgi:kynurenine formamidase
MSIKPMTWKYFIVGYVLALAMFLFAQRHPAPIPTPVFSSVVDLTQSSNGSAHLSQAGASIDPRGSGQQRQPLRPSAAEDFPTLINSPAQLYPGLWTVDQIPSQRLIARLVVVDVQRAAQSNPDYEVGMDDITSWENAHGKIPMGAVVIARTGWHYRWSSVRQYPNAEGHGVMPSPGYSVEVARFLVQGRNAVALGIDAPSIDSGASKDSAVRKYTEWHSVYELDNVASLSAVPDSGANVVVAPAKLQGLSRGPVRILALVK